MKYLLSKLGEKLKIQVRNNAPKTLADYNRETLIKAGKQQFEKLKDLGLNIPVALS